MTPEKRVKGSRALVSALEDEGCDVIFGFPGGVAIPFYDALYDAQNYRPKVRNMLGKPMFLY